MIKILLLLRVIWWERILWRRCIDLIFTQNLRVKREGAVARAAQMVVNAKQDLSEGCIGIRESDVQINLLDKT